MLSLSKHEKSTDEKMNSMWSAWGHFSDKCFKTIPSSPGIYAVRSVDSNGKPEHIGRLLFVDSEGLLYIGKTGKGRKGILTKRLAAFWKATVRGKGHSGGNKFCRILTDRLSRENLQYRWWTAKDLNQASQREKEALEKYCARFGELPPLNSAMPR